jgi:CRISPR-associated protein Csb2
LPSIGHVHADRAIRRVMVEVPGNCPLDAADVHWAFSGLELLDFTTGELQAILTRAADDVFLKHYGAEGSAHIWRTVTPLALPPSAAGARGADSRQKPKAGPARAAELAGAAFAVRQALRHAAVDAQPDAIHLQREPFDGNGSRAEEFAPATRFAKERLWHLELVFPRPVAGPLVIGDGRFIGLGVMAPIDGDTGICAFRIVAGLASDAQPPTIANAARRAVMARVRDYLGESKPLPPFFSGHEPNGAPAQSSHLAFIFDDSTSRLLIVAPHLLDHRQPTAQESRHLAVLDEALAGFAQLRAGAAGFLQLRAIALTLESDALLAPSRRWESATPYLVTHHAKRVGTEQTVIEDLRVECRRRGLPAPATVQPLELSAIPGLGLAANVRLTFRTAIEGPVLLGRSRYHGGGLFTLTARSHPK